MIDMNFPKISARNLQGQTVDVPDGLTGRVNLVVLAFLREQQHPVETWLPHLADLGKRFPGLEVWQVPALSRRYAIWRGAIDRGMRAGIPDDRVRSRTLTSYLDLDALQISLGLRTLDDIRLYLLDAGGTVRWEGSGGYDPQTFSSLEGAVTQLLGGA
jgi:hypothetical protein